SCCIGAAETATQANRLSRNYCGDRFAIDHGISIEDPAHDPGVGVHVGAGDVLCRPDHACDFARIASSDPLQLGARQGAAIDTNASLRTTEGNIDHGALGGHPCCKSHDLAKLEARMESNAPLSGSEGS